MMKLARRVACTGEMRISYKILVWKLEGMRQLWEPKYIDGRVMERGYIETGCVLGSFDSG
jgi:hypothetical protein